jgi:hypothetical protein
MHLAILSCRSPFLLSAVLSNFLFSRFCSFIPPNPWKWMILLSIIGRREIGRNILLCSYSCFSLVSIFHLAEGRDSNLVYLSMNLQAWWDQIEEYDIYCNSMFSVIVLIFYFNWFLLSTCTTLLPHGLEYVTTSIATIITIWVMLNIVS